MLLREPLCITKLPTHKKSSSFAFLLNRTPFSNSRESGSCSFYSLQIIEKRGKKDIVFRKKAGLELEKSVSLAGNFCGSTTHESSSCAIQLIYSCGLLNFQKLSFGHTKK